MFLAVMAAVAVFVSAGAGGAQDQQPLGTSKNPGAVQAPVGAPLWQGLSYGLSAEHVAAVLRSVDGIKSVEVKQRKNKPARLKILYSKGGVDVGPSRAQVETVFNSDGLTEVRLTIDDCASAIEAKTKTLIETLREKYGPGALVRLVDLSGQLIDTVVVFANNLTRLQLSYADYNPAIVEGSVPGSGALGAIGDIFGAMSANAAEKACPADAGARRKLTLTYSSQAVFLAEQAGFDAEKKRISEKAAKGL